MDLGGIVSLGGDIDAYVLKTIHGKSDVQSD